MHNDPHALATALTKLRPGATVDYHRLTTDGRSWVLFARRFWPSSDAEFEETWATHPPDQPTGTIYGKTVTFHRYQQSYGCDYKFTNQVAAALPLTAAPAPAAAVLDALRSVEAAAEPQNGALFNFYNGGSDYMGKHSDEERQLHRGAPIFSLSWCHPRRTHQRRFRLLPKDDVRDACAPSAWRDGSLKSQNALVMLGDGDLIVMGGACQTTHKHEVMQARSKELSEQHGRRINITVRSFADDSAAVTTAAPAPALTPAPVPAPTPAPASTLWRQLQPRAVVAAAAGRGADVCVGISASTAAGAAASDEARAGPRERGEDGISAEGSARRDGPAEGVRAEGVGAEGVQWACAACTFLNSALLPSCEMCDATRTTNPPPSPNAGAAAPAVRRSATGSPRKRAAPSAPGKETKQAKAPHNRQAVVDRTNPSIRNFFPRYNGDVH